MSKIKCFIKHSKTGAHEMYEDTVSGIKGLREGADIVFIMFVIFAPLIVFLSVGLALRTMDFVTCVIGFIVACVLEWPWFKCVADPLLSCLYKNDHEIG